MSELTKERMEEYARDGRNAGDCEVEQMARELLSLRSLRDAGDEEVNGIVARAMENPAYRQNAVDFLGDIAITRGQQLREAQAEIERFKGNTEQLILKLNGDLATITAERDELKAELAALKSCPSMAEVDALVAKWNEPGPWEPEVVSEALMEYETLARRSIASREEVVGLLDHILSRIITVRRENTPEWMEWIVEEINKVNEAIGDPDRAELIRGRILLVKSESEIVEGK